MEFTTMETNHCPDPNHLWECAKTVLIHTDPTPQSTRPQRIYCHPRAATHHMTPTGIYTSMGQWF